MKREIAAFDFDGTLTISDSMFPFMKHVLGKKAFYLSVFKSLPWLIAYVFRCCPNWVAKQKLFSVCFAGKTIQDLEEKAITFAKNNRKLLRQEKMDILKWHILSGHQVYVISASMEIWIRPFFDDISGICFLKTQPELSEGKLTGRFIGKNCYGIEKVERLKRVEPDREKYVLYAYGDSKGDDELLAWADYAFRE